MKKLMIFGDSIIKGVTYSGQSYHLCQDHDFDTIAAQGVAVENYARMGATIDAGLKQIDRRLAPCAEDTTVLFCFGGNDCDYDWKAISADPDVSICLTPRRSASSTATAPPSARPGRLARAWP